MADVISGLSRVHRISGAVQGYETLAVFGEGRAEPGGFDVFERSTDRALWIALLAPAAPSPLEQAGVNDSVRAALGGGDTGVPSLLSLGIVPALPLPALFEEVGPLAEVPVVWEMVTRKPGTQTPGLPHAGAAARQRHLARLHAPGHTAPAAAGRRTTSGCLRTRWV